MKYKKSCTYIASKQMLEIVAIYSAIIGRFQVDFKWRVDSAQTNLDSRQFTIIEF